MPNGTYTRTRSPLHQRALQVAAHAVEHLEFEGGRRYPLLLNEVARRIDHFFIVRRDAVINPAVHQDLRQP